MVGKEQPCSLQFCGGKSGESEQQNFSTSSQDGRKRSEDLENSAKKGTLNSSAQQMGLSIVS
jgi:hypothetical protein